MILFHIKMGLKLVKLEVEFPRFWSKRSNSTKFDIRIKELKFEKSKFEFDIIEFVRAFSYHLLVDVISLALTDDIE